MIYPSKFSEAKTIQLSITSWQPGPCFEFSSFLILSQYLKEEWNERQDCTSTPTHTYMPPNTCTTCNHGAELCVKFEVESKGMVVIIGVWWVAFPFEHTVLSRRVANTHTNIVLTSYELEVVSAARVCLGLWSWSSLGWGREVLFDLPSWWNSK